MADDRLDLALPPDVLLTMFDSTATQTQLNNNVVLGSSDDVDTLSSMIEDAEDEFRLLTDAGMEISRKGVPGNRPTFEQTTYKISGHQLTKGTFTGTWTEYLPEQKDTLLDEQNILPFDSSSNDAVYLYTGIADSGNSWEDVTDKEGEMWDILDPIEGRFTFSPIEIADEYLGTVDTAHGTVPQFLKRIRFAISYRYGGLGGSRARATQTDLDTSLTSSDTDTGTTAVADGSGFPTGTDAGSIIVMINREYLRVTPDPTNDSMTIQERGVRGTTAASHSSGDAVKYVPPAVRKAVAARAGMSLAQSGRYQDFVADVEDSLDRSDLIDEMEQTWQGIVTALGGTVE